MYVYHVCINKDVYICMYVYANTYRQREDLMVTHANETLVAEDATQVLILKSQCARFPYGLIGPMQIISYRWAYGIL